MKETEKKLHSKLTEYVLSRVNNDERFDDVHGLMELIRSEVGYIEKQEGLFAMVKHWLQGLGGSYEFETFKIVTMYNSRGIENDDWIEIDDDYRNRTVKIIIDLVMIM